MTSGTCLRAALVIFALTASSPSLAQTTSPASLSSRSPARSLAPSAAAPSAAPSPAASSARPSAAAPASSPAASPADPCDRCGKVESIKPVTSAAPWSPLGSSSSFGRETSAGGTSFQPAGVTAYQIGRDGTNKGQVLLGAPGGAPYTARRGEPQASRWEVTIKMDNGGARSVIQNYEPMLHEGDHVRVMGTQIEIVQ